MATIEQRLQYLEAAHGKADEKHPVPVFQDAEERRRYYADYEYQLNYGRSHGFVADRFFSSPEEQARFLARRRCILRRVHAEMKEKESHATSKERLHH